MDSELEKEKFLRNLFCMLYVVLSQDELHYSLFFIVFNDENNELGYAISKTLDLYEEESILVSHRFTYAKTNHEDFEQIGETCWNVFEKCQEETWAI